LLGIPDGPEGIRATLEIMRRLVRDARKTRDVRELALSLTAPTGSGNGKNYFGEVQALTSYVRDQIRYVQDVNEVETISPPSEVIRLGAGDCDDKAILLAALLESIGHPARFVALAFVPDLFEHVLVESKIGQTWMPLETTEEVPPGWYPEGVIGRMVRHI
jgi:transglutaminase-like putative cysteine protease